jgi:hypothetical protein
VVLFLKEPLVTILTLKILFGGFLGASLSPIFPIFQPFGFSSILEAKG